MTEEKIERNREMFRQWKEEGDTFVAIAKRYGISAVATRRIVLRMLQRETEEKEMQKKMENAKVLKFEDVMQWDRMMWLQCREMSCSVPVVYQGEHAPFLRYKGEHAPFLRYKGDGIALDIEVRGSYYGKTWRCFDYCPMYEDEYPWEDIDGRRGWLTWDVQPDE